jgi:hypothetical protein
VNRKQTIAIAVAAVAVFGGVAAAAHLWGQTQGDVAVKDDNAPTAVVTCGCEVQLYGFGSDPTVTQVVTSAGNASVSGPADASVRLDNIEGQTTGLSQISTSNGNLTVNPADKPAIRLAGGLTEITYRDATMDDGTTDFSYSADSTATVEIGGLPAGAATGAVNKTSGELIETAVADNSGRVTYDELPAGSTDVIIQKTPQTLFIRPETQPGQKIDTAEVEIRFFVQGQDGDEQVVTRSTSTGEISMTDLPKNRSFVVTASSSNYTDRRIYVDNLFEQQSVYLLSDDETSVTKIFEYSDFSGRFPQDETVLKFQRPINGEFVTVQGDVIGATGEYRVTMDEGERHRIVLLNRETGERRVQGAFTPLTSGTQAIEIYSNDEISVESVGPLLSFSPSIGVVPASETTVTTSVRRRDQDVTSATATLYSRSDGQLTQLAQDTRTGPGDLSSTVNLTNQSDSTLVVEIQYELADGTQSMRYNNYTVREQFDNQYSILNVIGNFGGLIPADNFEAFQAAVSIFTSVLIAAGAASQIRISGEGFGLIVVGVLAAWSIIGWIGYGLVFATGVSLGGLVVLRRGV